MKPVYVGNQIMEQYDLDMPVYIKSSSFPLVPQLVKGTAFEVLERTMHKGNIQRAVFESGSKMGGFKIIDSWNKVKDKEGNEVSLNGNKLTDGTFNVLFKYPENVLNWLNFLRANEDSNPLRDVFENEKYRKILN